MHNKDRNNIIPCTYIYIDILDKCIIVYVTYIYIRIIMTDTLAIARSMRNSAENGGLEEKVHKVRNNGSVFTKAYRDTITGDEIIHWLVNIKKLAVNEIDAAEIAQSLLSQKFIQRVEDQAKNLRAKASTRSVNTADAHFEKGTNRLYLYTKKVKGFKNNGNRRQRRGGRRKGKVKRFSMMGAREALVKDRERHMEEADNMGIKLFKVEDTLDHAHVTENRRAEVRHLKHGPTPLQRGRKLGINKEDILVPTYEPLFSAEDGQVYRLDPKDENNLKHHRLRLSPRFLHFHEKHEKNHYIFHHSVNSSKDHIDQLRSVAIPKANLAGQEVLCFVMKNETEEHVKQNLVMIEQQKKLMLMHETASNNR